jgi:hypothetical protein
MKIDHHGQAINIISNPVNEITVMVRCSDLFSTYKRCMFPEIFSKYSQHTCPKKSVNKKMFLFDFYKSQEKNS